MAHNEASGSTRFTDFKFVFTGPKGLNWKVSEKNKTKKNLGTLYKHAKSSITIRNSQLNAILFSWNMQTLTNCAFLRKIKIFTVPFDLAI